MSQWIDLVMRGISPFRFSGRIKKWTSDGSDGWDVSGTQKDQAFLIGKETVVPYIVREQPTAGMAEFEGKVWRTRWIPRE